MLNFVGVWNQIFNPYLRFHTFSIGVGNVLCLYAHRITNQSGLKLNLPIWHGWYICFVDFLVFRGFKVIWLVMQVVLWWNQKVISTCYQLICLEYTCFCDSYTLQFCGEYLTPGMSKFLTKTFFTLMYLLNLWNLTQWITCVR